VPREESGGAAVQVASGGTLLTIRHL